MTPSEIAAPQPSMSESKPASVGDLRRLVKKCKRERFSAMWFLEPIQAYSSYLLIRLRLNSLHVTVLWLLIALIGYGVMTVGTPVGFLIGSLCVCLKIILDGSDGEVARFHKQFVSEHEDLTSFVHGVYLDKIFHIIEKPLWGLSLGYGAYRMTGEPWLIAAGVSLAVFNGFCRHNATLQKEIPKQFAERVRRVFGPAENDVEAPVASDPLLVRVVDKFYLFMRNGKRFNLLIFGAALIDLCVLQTGGRPWGVAGIVGIAGVAAPVMMTFVIYRTVSTGALIKRAQRG
jgi:hypothetical protein